VWRRARLLPDTGRGEPHGGRQGRPQLIFFPGEGHRRRKGSVVGGHHGECRARTYNRGLGAEPPAGSRGRYPGQGSGGRSPPEAESILVIGCPTEPALIH